MFFTIFCLVFCCDSSREQSPPSGQVVQVVLSEQPTPGQRVSLEQARIMPELFFDIFGEKEVKTWQINWPILQDPTILFDDAQKRLLFKKIEEKFSSFSGCKTDNFYILTGKIADIKRQMTAAHEKRLTEIATAYFSHKFSGASVNITPKHDGVQLGAKVNINYDGSLFTFYVKTHSEGRLAAKSSAPKSVRPEELLIYEFLKRSLLGAECHFFHRSPEDTYIATLDASFLGGEKFQFKTLSRCVEEELGQLTGGLSRYVLEEVEPMEKCIANNIVAYAFVKSLVTTDLFSRIFRVTDVSDNDENYGFRFVPEQLPVLKIIDFRLREEQSFLVNREHFGGFLEGNGEFNYAMNIKPYTRYILSSRSREQRAETGKQVMTDLYKYKPQLDESFASISSYLGDAVFTTQRSMLMADLKKYYEAVSLNFDCFMQLFSEIRT